MSSFLRIALRVNAPLTLALATQAQTITSTVGLNAAQEVPPPAVPSTGTGMATVTIDATTRAISVSGTYSGLTSNQTLAHIHSGAFGVSGGVLINLSGTGGTTGSFSGTGVLTSGQFNTLLAGDLYLNLHTAMNGPGELRGQIVNLTGVAALPTDPTVFDTGGNPIRGPRIGNAVETYNIALDCSNAGAPGNFAIIIHLTTVAPPLAGPFGSLWFSGPKVFSSAGVHAQNVVNAAPAPGIMLPPDPALVSLTYNVQGFCFDPSAPPGRLSNVLIQVVEQ
jgi:hypothetical protein